MSLSITSLSILFIKVVVDNEVTAKDLLQKGELKRRVTILPLNKIKGGGIDDVKAAAAGKIASQAGGTATRAIELVGYDSEVKAAMQYVFGNAIVCDTLETARAVALSSSVHKKVLKKHSCCLSHTYNYINFVDYVSV